MPLFAARSTVPVDAVLTSDGSKRTLAVYLYNTISGRKEEFLPQDPGRVTMYVCGPTVYGYAHIGNARPAVVFDVLARLLRHRFPGLVYARNITDIDDKINAAATEEGVDIGVITDRYTRAYHEDLEALQVLPPDIEPRVTTHLAEIIGMIEVLVEAGHAYAAEGHVLFHVPSYHEYGVLSHRDRNDMLAGARVEVTPYKKDPADFVLWKPSTPEQPGWDSPWGRGRPGWHIECSTMIATHLGVTIDIHGGGNDLIFPHHENELAQSTCAHQGRLFCRHWVHNGFVNVDSEKMSKSMGNVLLVRDLLQQAPGEAIRMALLSAHYRAPLDWTENGLQQARRRLDGLYQALRDAPGPERPLTAEDVSPAFLEALEDDLNTPRALAELSAIARAINSSSSSDAKTRQMTASLLSSGALLGLLQTDPETWFAGSARRMDVAEIERLIQQRTAARSARDFATADRIREDLGAMGILIEDGAEGTRWRSVE